MICYSEKVAAFFGWGREAAERALLLAADLPEDPSSVPSTHTSQLNHLSLQFQGNPSRSSAPSPHMLKHTDTHLCTYTYIKKQNILKCYLCLHVCACMHMQRPKEDIGCSVLSSPPYSLETGSLSELGSRLDGHSQRSPYLGPRQCWSYRQAWPRPVFYVGAGT